MSAWPPYLPIQFCEGFIILIKIRTLIVLLVHQTWLKVEVSCIFQKIITKPGWRLKVILQIQNQAWLKAEVWRIDYTLTTNGVGYQHYGSIHTKLGRANCLYCLWQKCLVWRIDWMYVVLSESSRRLHWFRYGNSWSYYVDLSKMWSFQNAKHFCAIEGYEAVTW